eukprot:s1854_g19.t1
MTTVLSLPVLFVLQLHLKDSVSKIQQRFPAKVLPFALQGPGGIPITFYSVWDRIVEFLRYEGKVTSREIGDLSYCAEASSNVQWKQLNMPLPGIDQGKREFRRPQLFRGTRMAENLLRKYTSQGQHGWPHNREAKWRLQALARGLGLPLPMPYRAPYVPGLSVLIPHYGESILAEKQLELLREPEEPESDRKRPYHGAADRSRVTQHWLKSRTR